MALFLLRWVTCQRPLSRLPSSAQSMCLRVSGAVAPSAAGFARSLLCRKLQQLEYVPEAEQYQHMRECGHLVRPIWHHRPCWEVVCWQPQQWLRPNISATILDAAMLNGNVWRKRRLRQTKFGYFGKSPDTPFTKKSMPSSMPSSATAPAGTRSTPSRSTIGPSKE